MLVEVHEETPCHTDLKLEMGKALPWLFQIIGDMFFNATIKLNKCSHNVKPSTELIKFLQSICIEIHSSFLNFSWDFY